MGAAFFQKGGVLLKLFEKSFTKNFFMKGSGQQDGAARGLA
ncbi:hypothetical protein SXCC_01186 [Gluconacetobacter sp. SXCC-1]|nr:hypothetical protein SXCC_01186 [Gluconacetobacter sp. SXCC-1]